MYFIIFMLGLFLGSKIFAIRYSNGEFLVDQRNDAKDIFTVCIKDFEKLPNNKYIILKVEHQ